MTGIGHIQGDCIMFAQSQSTTAISRLRGRNLEILDYETSSSYMSIYRY